MEYVLLGKTGLSVSRTGFGCLPIQRVGDSKTSTAIIRSAYDAGVNFYDTARLYGDSEYKLGLALADVRKNIIIASKTMSVTAEKIQSDLEESLRQLKTDYIDVYQLHNPSFVPQPNEENKVYDTLLQAKKAGKIRFIGFTNHSVQRANEATLSGLYDTIQYPFSYLAIDDEKKLVELCAEKRVGFIAMKSLCGGLLSNALLAFSFLRQYEQVIPIWGIQKQEEIQEILRYEENPPAFDAEIQAAIDADKKSLMGNFCRNCAYCQPCPQGIPIENVNRMTQLLTRMPVSSWLTSEWYDKMQSIRTCIKCGLCETRCPYGLKPFETLPNHLDFFEQMWNEREK
ncbi:MAG: aldo/keto reductase [Treponemataceae bacterium]